MAKKQDLGDIFKRTEPAQPPTEEADPVTPRGVGLRQSEWAQFNGIARELGMKPHALALWVLRDFIRRYDAGEIRTQTRKSLPGA